MTNCIIILCIIDINECTNGEHTCHSELYCTNTQGDYTCDCPSGYLVLPLNPKRCIGKRM